MKNELLIFQTIRLVGRVKLGNMSHWIVLLLLYNKRTKVNILLPNIDSMNV